MNELYHHGIKGMKWGIRRYQNADGSLTAEGAARYGSSGKPDSFQKNAFIKPTEKMMRKSEKADRKGQAAVLDALTKTERGDSKGASKSWKKAGKYMKKSVDFLNRADQYKVMNQKYSNLSQDERSRMKAQRVVASIIGGGIGASIVTGRQMDRIQNN